MSEAVAHDRLMDVILTAAEWNTVLSILTEAAVPYRVSAPIIAKLQDQLVTQARAENEGQDVSRQD